MIIIVEGIDRVGKTTLCKKICEELGYFYYKAEFDEKQTWIERMADQIKDLARFDKMINQGIIKGVVIDRLHLTEKVYGKLERGYDCKTNKIVEEIIPSLSSKCILILVYPEDLKRSSKEHGKNLERHCSKFDFLFYYSRMKEKIKCSYSNFDKVIKELKKKGE